MGNPPRYGGLDAFKVIAALLVVAIHTSPLTTYSPDGDFLLTRSLARVAVPFFFMVTGQFVLGEVLQGRRPFSALWRQVKKILLLYLVAVVLYLPVGLYAGHYQGLSPLSALRLLLFDGTFYHLWYFPACATGLLLVYLLGRVLRGRGLLAVTGLLYLIGLFGDSYYGLTATLPPLAAAYGLPRETPEQQARKAAVLAEALDGACAVPLDLMDACCEGIRLAADYAEKGSVLAVSDAGCAALFCKAALQASALNVAINTKLMTDRAHAAALDEKAARMLAEYLPLADEVYQSVASRLRA